MSFDTNGDIMIPVSDIRMDVPSPNSPTVIEDISDESSQYSLDVRPLSLHEVGHEPDSLPNLEEDVEEVATVDMVP